MVCEGATPSTSNFGSTDPRWSEIADFQPIIARSSSAVTPSEKSSINANRLIGKRVVDFVLVLIELFSLGLKAEALRANIGSISDISFQRGPVDPKFQVEGVAPPTILLLGKLG